MNIKSLVFFKVLFVAALFSFVVKDPNNLRHIELDVDRLKQYSVYHINRNRSCYLGKRWDLANVVSYRQMGK